MQYRRYQLIGSDRSLFPQEVRIFFDDVEVERLSTLTAFVWNAGAETIRGSDVVQSDPIRVVFSEGTQLLRARVVRITREVNAVEIAINHEIGSVDVFFDFLDPGDGVAIEVLHSGNRPAALLVGTVRGLPAGVRSVGPIPTEQGPMRLPLIGRSRTIAAVGTILGLGLAGMAGFAPWLSQYLPAFFDSSAAGRPTQPEWWMVGVGLLYAAPFLALGWVRRRRFPAILDDQL